MPGSWLRLTFPRRAALTALVAFTANVASAQNVVFSGKVTTEGGQPLAGAAPVCNEGTCSPWDADCAPVV